MYKTKINIKENNSELKELSGAEFYCFRDKNRKDSKMIVTCQTDESAGLNEGDVVVVIFNSNYHNEESGDNVRTNVRNNYSVLSYDDNDFVFTFLADEYNELYEPKIWCVTPNTDSDLPESDVIEQNYLIEFGLPHLLVKSDIYNPIIYAEVVDENDGIKKMLPFECYCDDDFKLQVVQYYTNTTPRTISITEYETLTLEEKGLYKRINWLYYNTSDFIDFNAFSALSEEQRETYEQIPLVITDLFDGLLENGGPATLPLFREDIIFNDIYGAGNTRIYKQEILASINIPLSNQFGTDLYQEHNIREQFVGVEKQKAINSVNEMEKDLYHPYIKTYIKNGDKLTEVLTEVREIIFNFHFKERSHNSDWKINEGGKWNGEDFLSSDEKNTFFSYGNKSRQSDSLYYLGFSDSDVMFQRNRLKKTFIRLSFYDSDKPTNQRLLSYATIYLDAGTLFGKYTRNVDGSGEDVFYFKSGSEGTEANGIRCQTEPFGSNAFDRLIDEADVENYRLSSRISVKDRSFTSKSSEGFYLYLWKNIIDDLGRPDIYMRIDFNHAGFGRVIPFMMPYIRNDKTGGRVKTFEEIVTDFTDDNNGYGLSDYQRFAHIHLKLMHNKELGRYIYYVDENQYGNSLSDGDKLYFNLYEARIKS